MSHSPLSIFTVAVLRAGMCFSAHWLALLGGNHSGMLVGFHGESHSTPPWPAIKVLASGELLYPPPLEKVWVTGKGTALPVYTAGQGWKRVGWLEGIHKWE